VIYPFTWIAGFISRTTAIRRMGEGSELLILRPLYAQLLPVNLSGNYLLVGRVRQRPAPPSGASRPTFTAQRRSAQARHCPRRAGILRATPQSRDPSHSILAPHQILVGTDAADEMLSPAAECRRSTPGLTHFPDTLRNTRTLEGPAALRWLFWKCHTTLLMTR